MSDARTPRSKYRDYGAVGALIVFAVGPFAIGSLLESWAVAAPGFALLGAGLARWDDVSRRHYDERRSADAERRRDVDETRRLGYALLAEPHPKNEPLLIGTIANALVHHHGVEEGLEGELILDSLHMVSHFGRERHADWFKGVLANLDETS